MDIRRGKLFLYFIFSCYVFFVVDGSLILTFESDPETPDMSLFYGKSGNQTLLPNNPLSLHNGLNPSSSKASKSFWLKFKLGALLLVNFYFLGTIIALLSSSKSQTGTNPLNNLPNVRLAVPNFLTLEKMHNNFKLDENSEIIGLEKRIKWNHYPSESNLIAEDYYRNKYIDKLHDPILIKKSYKSIKDSILYWRTDSNGDTNPSNSPSETRVYVLSMDPSTVVEFFHPNNGKIVIVNNGNEDTPGSPSSYSSTEMDLCNESNLSTVLTFFQKKGPWYSLTYSRLIYTPGIVITKDLPTGMTSFEVDVMTTSFIGQNFKNIYSYGGTSIQHDITEGQLRCSIQMLLQCAAIRERNILIVPIFEELGCDIIKFTLKAFREYLKKTSFEAIIFCRCSCSSDLRGDLDFGRRFFSSENISPEDITKDEILDSVLYNEEAFNRLFALKLRRFNINDMESLVKVVGYLIYWYYDLLWIIDLTCSMSGVNALYKEYQDVVDKRKFTMENAKDFLAKIRKSKIWKVSHGKEKMTVIKKQIALFIEKLPILKIDGSKSNTDLT